VALVAIAGVISTPARAQRIVATIPVAGGPVGLGLSSDQLFLYVCNLATDLGQVIDISKR
jgi:DNA-binding beta-propeller fold protein YncE